MSVACQDELLPELETFLKKLGIGKTTIWNYKGCMRAMLKILEEKKLPFGEIETPVFQEEFFRVNTKNRKQLFNTIKRFLWYKGLFGETAKVAASKNKLEKERQEFLKELGRRGFKEGTITGSECDTRKFMQFCEAAGVTTIDGLSKRIVDSYLTHLFVAEENKYCLNKKIKILYELKNFFTYLFESGKTLFNMSTYIEVPRREKKISRNFLKRDEITKLFKQVDTNTVLGFMDHTIFEILYSTGMRVGELCSLKTSDVDPENGTLFIKEGKGGKDRIVPLTEIAIKYLELYLENVRRRILGMAERITVKKVDTDYLFLGVHGKKIDEAFLTRLIIHYLADAGLKKRSAHAFRYSCATHMLENGADIRYIGELLGHRDLNTTGGYTKVSTKNLIEAIRHHPRANEKSCPFKGEKKRS